jgi:hypothetical protein
MTDIFISYSRRDKEFVHKLVDALREKEREVWVDFEDIPFGSDWWAEIVAGIEGANAAIFCISPDSVQSEVCSMEIAEIIKYHKKLVPIVVRQPDEFAQNLPHAISHLNWVFFDDDTKFEPSLTALLKTIDTDLELEKDKTRLLIRAREWENNAHNNSMLLRGDELSVFLPLRDEPSLTDLQRTYLQISHRHDINRQQLLRFAYGFLAGVLAMGFYIFTTFRSDSFISPQRITLTLAAGELFGLFTGIIAVFAQDVLLQIKQRIPKQIHLLLQIVVCLLSGTLAWLMFHGVILNYWPDITSSTALPILWGGIGLASGFIINAILKPSPLLTVVISFIGIYLPIWTFNNYAQIIADSNEKYLPLLYFEFGRPQDVYWVGIPMALLLAIGANLQILLRWYQNLRSPQKLKRKVKVAA